MLSAVLILAARLHVAAAFARAAFTSALSAQGQFLHLQWKGRCQTIATTDSERDAGFRGNPFFVLYPGITNSGLLLFHSLFGAYQKRHTNQGIFVAAAAVSDVLFVKCNVYLLGREEVTRPLSLYIIPLKP